MAKERLTKGEIWLIVVTILLVLLGGGYAYWEYVSNINPVVIIPAPPALPSPNARDVYLAAAQLKVDSLTIGTRTVTVDDTYDCIRGGVVGPGTRGKKTPPPLVDMQALVTANAPAFAKVRQGFAYEYGSTPMRSLNTLFPEYAQFRGLARAMMADGDVLCATGQWDTATERYLDCIRMGADIPRGGPLIGGLVGVAVQAIGRMEIWTALDHVNGPEARLAARRLEKITPRQVPYANILQEEKWGWQAGLLEAFQSGQWHNWFSYLSSDAGGERWIYNFRLFFVSKRTVMRNFTVGMDAMIANAKQPFPQCAQSPALPNDLISQKLLPVFDKAWEKFAVNGTQNDLLMVSFALRAYKVEHGTCPASLRQLVPAYLKAIPTDFFSNKPLKYKVKGASYILYSVGPDGKDDGGKASADGQRILNGKLKAGTINSNSTGDIVAGVNKV